MATAGSLTKCWTYGSNSADYTARNMKHSPSAGSLSAQRRRRWANREPALGEHACTTIYRSTPSWMQCTRLIPANTRSCSNVRLLLGQCRRRWASIGSMSRVSLDAVLLFLPLLMSPPLRGNHPGPRKVSLVQVTINRRLLIRREGHLDQSEDRASIRTLVNIFI